MKLTAIFESWYIGDGNYPPLLKGQLVNLSFVFEPRVCEKVALEIPDKFEHLGNGEYHFCGTVLKIYENDPAPVLIIHINDFRFYITSYEVAQYAQGGKVSGEGTLVIDPYDWVEFLDKYKDPPNLFYNLKVTGIRKVNIPEIFIHRHEQGKSLPTRLLPEDYFASSVEVLDTMVGQAFDEEFYIIDFDGTGLEESNVPRTFLE